MTPTPSARTFVADSDYHVAQSCLLDATPAVRRSALFKHLERLVLFPLPQCLRKPQGDWEENGFSVANDDGSLSQYSIVRPAASGLSGDQLVELFSENAPADRLPHGLSSPYPEKEAQLLAQDGTLHPLYTSDLALKPEDFLPLGVQHAGNLNASYSALLRNRHGKFIGYVMFDVAILRAFNEDLDKGTAPTDEEAIALSTSFTLHVELKKVYVRWPHRGVSAARAASLLIQEVVEEHVISLASQLDALSWQLGLDFSLELHLSALSTSLAGDAFVCRVVRDLERFAQACSSAGERRFDSLVVSSIVDTFGCEAAS